jgi:hypothetical protein
MYSKAVIAMRKRNLIRVSSLAVVVALWSAFAPTPARADLSVYVTGSGNEFGTLDLATGSFSLIATLNLPAGDNIYGMGYGANGMLYGVDSQPNANLWQINPSNGGLIDLSAIGSSAAGASSDASGNLYVISQDVDAFYYTMNPPSTVTSTPLTTGITTAGGLMAFNTETSQLFATNNTGTTWDLDSINTSTGVATLVGNTDYTPDAGIFVGGTLYGFDTTSNAIVTLDTSNGTGSYVATYSLPNGDLILSAALVPEPSSLVLGLIGAVLAGSFGLIRHQRPAPEPR